MSIGLRIIFNYIPRLMQPPLNNLVERTELLIRQRAGQWTFHLHNTLHMSVLSYIYDTNYRAIWKY